MGEEIVAQRVLDLPGGVEDADPRDEAQDHSNQGHQGEDGGAPAHLRDWKAIGDSLDRPSHQQGNDHEAGDVTQGEERAEGVAALVLGEIAPQPAEHRPAAGAGLVSRHLGGIHSHSAIQSDSLSAGITTATRTRYTVAEGARLAGSSTAPGAGAD